VEEILILLAVLALITVVGHGIWVGLAWLGRAITRTVAEEARRAVESGHSERFRGSSAVRLPSAEKHVESIGDESQELEAMARQVRRFQERGELDVPTADRLRAALEARRQALMKPSSPDLPERVLAVAAPLVSLADRLEELLSQCGDVRNLTLDNRRQALAWSLQLTDEEQADLSAPTLLAVARLLSISGMTSRALAVYCRLLDLRPDYEGHAAVALEAGRLAARDGRDALARTLLEQALSEGLSPEARQEAEHLLDRLDREEAAGQPAEEQLSASAVIQSATSDANAIPWVQPVEERLRAVPAGDKREPVGESTGTTTPRPVHPAPALPKRSWTDLLAGFMEDRNILWGELVGGLLIVGCSIALVITLWQRLEEVPYFPFLVFVAITLGTFGAGQYTLHHWKLESISRGLLVIALLLVPLNLLVLADPSRAEPGGWLEWGIKAVALASFAALIGACGRDLLGGLSGVKSPAFLLTLAVVGAAGSQLFASRLLDPDQPLRLAILALVPVACFVLPTVTVLLGLVRGARGADRCVGEQQVNGLFLFVGVAAFAVAIALGFLTSRAGDFVVALQHLAASVSVAGIPVLLSGLLVHQELAGGVSTSDQRSAKIPGLRTAGTGVALAGMAIMLAALALAWPQPVVLLLVCAVDAAVFTAVAFRARLPLAHAVALPCLALGFLLAFHYLVGRLPAPNGEVAGLWLGSLLLSTSSGAALVVLAPLLAGGAEWLVRSKRREHALGYALGAAGAGLLGLQLLTWHGFEVPAPAALGYAWCSALVLVLNLRWQRSVLAHLGIGLLLGASFWGLRWGWPEYLPLWSLVFALESAALALNAARPTRAGEPVGLKQVTAACFPAALIAALASLWMAATAPDFPRPALHTYTAASLAATAFLLAQSSGRRVWTWIGSAFVLATLVHALVWHFPAWGVLHPLLAALLGHATLAWLAQQGTRAWATAKGGGTPETSLHPLVFLFAEPLRQSALATSLLSVPLLLAPLGGTSLQLAGYAAWLALLWLAEAWRQRSPAWFTACQAALSVAAVYGVSAWLDQQTWFGDVRFVLADPRCLQAYGVGLGLLALFGTLARTLLHSHPTAQALWQAPWPPLDRVVLAGLVVGQLALAVWGILPGVVAELTPAGFAVDLPWPTEHVLAHGTGAWIVVGTLAAVLTAGLWERGTSLVLPGLIVLAVTIPVLVAGLFVPDLAAASALRWGLAALFLACSVPVWRRGSLGPLTSAVRIDVGPVSLSAASVRRLLLVATATPVLLLTLVVAALGFSGTQPSGPVVTSLFHRMGWVSSNVGPLVLITAALVGHAFRERSPAYAFVSGLVTNLAASLVVCHVFRGKVLAEWWVVLAQTNVIITAAVALLWSVVRLRLEGWQERDRLPGLLTVQSLLGLLGITLLLLIPLGFMLSEPDVPLAANLRTMGHGGGWLALALSATAALGQLAWVAPRLRVHVLGLCGLAMGVLSGCLAAWWDAGSWLSFHVLMATWCLLGLAAVAVGALVASRRPAFAFLPMRPVRHWLEILGCAILVLVARCAGDDPTRPYAPAAATLIVSVLAGALALWFRRGIHVYASGLLLNVAGMLLWLTWGPATLSGFLLTNALCLAMASALWSSIEIAMEASSPEKRRRNDLAVEEISLVRLPPSFFGLPPFAHFAIRLGLTLLALVVVLGLASDLGGAAFRLGSGLAWRTLAAVGLALGIGLWDRRARFTAAGLYGLGLLAFGLALHDLELGMARLLWSTSLALAAYALLTSLIYWAVATDGGRSATMSDFISLLRLPSSAFRLSSAWFLPAQAISVCAVFALSTWTCLEFSTLPERLAGPLATSTLVASGVVLASRATGRWDDRLRLGTLLLGVMIVTETGWAVLGPTAPALWLHRNVWLMVSLALMTLAYGTALGRLLPARDAWVEWGRRLGPVLGVLASLMLVVLLGQELRLYDQATRRTPMALPAVVVVLVGYVLLMVAAIRFAVLPGRDPLGLSERGRTAYVYAAEVLLVLLFVHVRLNVPELFTGFAARYWTLLVMLIAYASVGLGEFFERRRLSVLAEPLRRTGVFLPLVPLVGFWTGPLAADLVGGPFPAPPGPWLSLERYAILWFLVSGLYVFVATTQRSFRFALLAALAANGGLWALLAHHGVAFLRHPQAWLIPLAVILLLAEYLNRDRLPRELSLGLRYLGLSMVYVSSTADMFIAGVGTSAVWPVVLAVLAVAGVLLGILLRVRAFLFLGVGFLFLDVFAMIWHAAVDNYQTWVWWVAGIVLGAAILALFAIFEKRRNDVLRLIEEIKRWH
jgi:hypothetical protein